MQCPWYEVQARRELPASPSPALYGAWHLEVLHAAFSAGWVITPVLREFFQEVPQHSCPLDPACPSAAPVAVADGVCGGDDDGGDGKGGGDGGGGDGGGAPRCWNAGE